jgi:UDP-N-acetyl-D-galactosamine dehydrogenase
MGAYVVSQLIKAMTKRRIHVDGAKVLILGLSFKENCPDIRNTRIVDIYDELKEYNCAVDIYDPWVNPEEACSEYGITLLDRKQLLTAGYDAVILAVAHSEFKKMGINEIRRLVKNPHVIYDLKYMFDIEDCDLRL